MTERCKKNLIMKFPTPLLRGVFLRRYKRFFADIRLDSGQEITAHTPNTGALLTCTDEGEAPLTSLHPLDPLAIPRGCFPDPGAN